jgi:hypothetical protein
MISRPPFITHRGKGRSDRKPPCRRNGLHAGRHRSKARRFCYSRRPWSTGSSLGASRAPTQRGRRRCRTSSGHRSFGCHRRSRARGSILRKRIVLRRHTPRAPTLGHLATVAVKFGLKDVGPRYPEHLLETRHPYPSRMWVGWARSPTTAAISADTPHAPRGLMARSPPGDDGEGVFGHGWILPGRRKDIIGYR